MRKLSLWAAVLTLFIVLLPATTLAATFKAGDVIDLSDAVEGDAFLSGRLVTLDQPIAGEAFLAGETVNVKSSVSRSIWAAGNTVTLQGAGYNAFAAGNNVTLRGEYGNDVYLAGSIITLDSDAHVKGDLKVAAAQVILHGRVDGDVYVDANMLDFDGTVGGSLKGSIYQLTLSGGTIAGDLSYTSDRDATGLGSTEVGGTTTRTPFDDTPYWQIQLVGFLFSLLTLLVLGGVMIAISRRRVEMLAADISAKRGLMAGVGVITLLLAPVVIFGLFLSVVGITLGFALLAFYVLALLIASVPALLSLGDQLATWFRWNITSPFNAFVLGAVAYLVVVQVPILGFFALIAYFAFYFLPAFGALVSRVIERRR